MKTLAVRGLATEGKTFRSMSIVGGGGNYKNPRGDVRFCDLPTVLVVTRPPRSPA